MKRHLTWSCLALLIILCLYTFPSFAKDVLVLKDVKRKADCDKAVVIITTNLQFENTGDASVSRFYYALPKWQDDLLGGISATQGDDSLDVKKIKDPLSVIPDTPKDVALYRVLIPQGIEKGATSKIDILLHVGKSLTPYPRKVPQEEDQYVVYEDMLYFYTPYVVKKQKLTVKTPSSDIQSVTPDDTSSKDATGVTFGPYTDEQEPFMINTSTPFASVHFSMTKPLPVLKKVFRDIEVSQFGNVFFHESFELTNEAAELKGEFSRIPFMMRTQRAAHHIDNMGARVPHPIQGLFYYDHIGNISSSSTSIMKNGHWIKLELQPRYPILGGWTADWQLKYNVPSTSVMFINSTDPHKHVLEIPFSHPIDKVFTEDMTIRIALPMGASKVRFELPRDVEEVTDEIKWSWFDVLQGRPTKVLHIKNYYVTSVAKEKIRMYYHYSGVAQYKRAIVLILFFFIPFALFILSQRFTFSTLTDTEQKSEDRKLTQKVISQDCRDAYDALCVANGGLLSAAKKHKARFESAKNFWKSVSAPAVAELKELSQGLAQTDKIEEALDALQEEVLRVATARVNDEGKGKKDEAGERRLAELEAQLFDYWAVPT